MGVFNVKRPEFSFSWQQFKKMYNVYEGFQKQFCAVNMHTSYAVVHPPLVIVTSVVLSHVGAFNLEASVTVYVSEIFQPSFSGSPRKNLAQGLKRSRVVSSSSLVSAKVFRFHAAD